MLLYPFLSAFILLLSTADAVTVYDQFPLSASAASSTVGDSIPAATYTAAAAYDPTVLNPPPIPDPPPSTQFVLQLHNDAGDVQGLSTPLSGALLGFSIEMSVADQVLGPNGTHLQVPFLNLMALITERAGRVHVRVGGNSQENAMLISDLPNGKSITKQSVDGGNPTDTPALLYTLEILYMLSNISGLVNTKWYLGVPLNDSSNLHLAIAEYGERILGDNLIGLQIGNEPDLYARHSHRPATYSPYDYFSEFGQVVQAMQADANTPVTNNLLALSVATGDWTPEDVWNTNFIPAYMNNLAALTVEHYPNDNCAALYPGFGPPQDPQSVFPSYLTHASCKSIVAPYLNSSAIALAAGKPFVMFETNTASCGGFPGISDSFGVALWVVDYALQMGASDFSHALLHVGGQDVYYNPFTPPLTNQSKIHQWTIGPIFYSVLAVAETLGSSNHSQIIDLASNGDNDYTPGYAVYENGTLMWLALINFMTDPSGANDYTVTISVGGNALGQPSTTPSQIRLKYLLAPSVGEKFNITWAGQTFGGQFESDGCLRSAETTQTVDCDTANNTCQVTVPAPGFALVFLSDGTFEESTPTSTHTFATTVTAVGEQKYSTTVDPSTLQTSNGHKGADGGHGSTSKGKHSGATAAGIYPSVVLLLAMLAGVGVLIRAVGNGWS
ncbi:glycoside hydrolase family 79 protein [Laetiporus sulphureus 93-53]|uniref:Glycoside hydrolase family 79 protein n=1 Tax=Laetiporus sulphureus 93-53 TaxID=1314785 RepID=A0A165B3R9_9APHY|nr:glycoside hydrolase family 79 protein [Laetiporus sulphureus 93-53]KZT00169.1 glycoside hydrolase family 79 protein [Laetiporus sulphureus 93-53]